MMDDLKQPLGDEAALAVTTAALHGQRLSDLPLKLAALGELAIRRRAEAKRTRPTISTHHAGTQIKVNVKAAVQSLAESFDQNSVSEAITKLGSAVEAGCGTITRRHALAMQSIDNFLKVQDEELEMLWWLVGEYSVSYSCPFENVPTAAKPLVFSTELAKMTTLQPGPTSIPALLSRSGLSNREEIKVHEVINSIGTDWLEERTASNLSSPLTTPIHEGVKRRLETGESDAWIAGWSAVAELPGELELTPLQISTQFYREELYLTER